MPKYECFRLTMRLISGKQNKTWLGMYGGESPKLIQIWSNVDYAEQLYTKLDRTKFKVRTGTPIAYTYQDKSGKMAVVGGPGLKQTQTYPLAFGAKVASLFCENMATPCRPFSNTQLDEAMHKVDWAPARLEKTYLWLVKKLEGK